MWQALFSFLDLLFLLSKDSVGCISKCLTNENNEYITRSKMKSHWMNFHNGKRYILSKRVRFRSEKNQHARLDYFHSILFSAMSRDRGNSTWRQLFKWNFPDFHALSSGNQDGLYHNNIEGDPSSFWHFRGINVVKFALQEWQMKLPFFEIENFLFHLTSDLNIRSSPLSCEI